MCIRDSRRVKYKNKWLPIPTALEMMSSLEPSQKQKLWSLIMTELKQIGEFSEHELNAIITDALEEDKLRGYQKPYSATALSYEDSESSIENLTQAVTNHHLSRCCPTTRRLRRF